MIIYAYGVPGEIAVGRGHTAVPVYVQFVVTGGQTLQRVRFLLVGYSKRGHPVRQSNGKIMAIRLNSTASFKAGDNYEVNSFHARPAGFPGGMVACVQLIGVSLLFVDGKSRTFDVGELQALLLPALRGRCPDLGPALYMKRREY